MRWLALMAVLGLTACAEPVGHSGLCSGLRRPAADHRAALTRHAKDTPEAVGETGTDLVLAVEAGCAWPQP